MLLISKGYKYFIEPHLKYKPIVKLDEIDIKRVTRGSSIRNRWIIYTEKIFWWYMFGSSH
jgi:hypothetical protein